MLCDVKTPQIRNVKPDWHAVVAAGLIVAAKDTMDPATYKKIRNEMEAAFNSTDRE